MKRILIIGCGGSGKSTLARALGEKTGLPVIHLDKLWWRPGWESVTREEFDILLEQELTKESWIMDGNFERTLPHRLEFADRAIYLDFDRLTCVLGVLHRILATHGKVRSDMGEGCPERLDWEFLGWVWNFNRNKRAKILAQLEAAKGVDVVILKNRRQVRQFLKNS